MAVVLRAVVLGASCALAFAVSCSSEDAKKTGPLTGNDAGAIAEPCVPDESGPVPKDRCSEDGSDSSLPKCGEWTKVEIPGTVCGDGSQYKFFVNYSNKSNDLVVSFEPGGACWDYESCSGAGGIRGAANPHGIPDDHMSKYQYLNLLQRSDVNPAQDYNMVFLSYCTGDVHSGNNVITYEKPTDVDAGPSAPDELVFHHAGHGNTMAVIDWMNDHFKTVPKMLVTGCSAGGAGAIINYYFIREGMKGAQCGYLLDDSGPIFHSDGPSKALHAKTRSSWDVDSVLDTLQGKLSVSPDAIKKDFGLMNEALADKYPSDRLTLTMYRMDLNYSLYSYQRFFDHPTEQQIHDYWWEDITELRKTYDAYPNLAYYFPYFREDNCSHCVSIPPLDHVDATLEYVLVNPWFGSEIQSKNVTLKDFAVRLLDDTKPLIDYVEDPIASEKFTDEQSNKCMEGG
jgi:hypothetical protein